VSTTPFLTVPQVARWLGRTPARCYQMARAGALPVVEVGGRLVVPRAALEQWVLEKAERALARTQRDGHGRQIGVGGRGGPDAQEEHID
jgi:excisionase family DNA binding protein